MDELIAERIKGWQDVIDYLENEIKTVDDRSAGLPSLKAIEVTVLKTIIYALKEGKETQLAKVRDRPELSHTHKWENGETYNHSHKRGNISHGHHGSRYVKYRDRPENIEGDIEAELSQYGAALMGWKSWGMDSVERMHELKLESVKVISALFDKDKKELWQLLFDQTKTIVELGERNCSLLVEVHDLQRDEDGIRKDYDELILEMRREFDAKITLAKEVVRKDERERIATEELGIILPDYDRININAGIRKLMQALKEGK